jgi:hypothetical protein
MSSKPLYQLVDELSTSGMTTFMLKALDFVIPGEYRNLTGFKNTIQVISGEDDPALIQKIGDRAIKLFNDSTQGYQRALWLYQTVDSLQGWMGAAVMANKIGERFSAMSFLGKITPKAEKVQVLNLGVKLVTEIAAFCYINGIPGDSIKDFLKSITDMQEERKMRMAALICVDGLLPLGPDFISKMLSLLQSTGVDDLQKNERFQKVASMLPGDSPATKLGFIQESTKGVSDWMKNFTTEHGLTVDKIAGSLKKYVDYAGDKMDYLAAFLDMTTNYFEHTGIQTIARQVTVRALAEI